MAHYLNLLSLFFLAASCATSNSSKIRLTEKEAWELSYRMFKSSILEEVELGSKQFDSLLNSNVTLEPKFIHVGIGLLLKKKEYQKAIDIFNQASTEAKVYVCKKGQLSELAQEERAENLCAGLVIEKEIISHPEIQKELVMMLYNDQTVRGADMSGLAKDFGLNIDSTSYKLDGVGTDALNREKLKNIIAKYGFPTKAMVGEVGMESVFLVIQHADQDKVFQASQFQNIENAVKNGDLEGQKYAYLYDRIKINSGEPQLYGTQFSKVDIENNIVELAPVEDIENLDMRRKAMGMMPINIYKELMLSQINK